MVDADELALLEESARTKSTLHIHVNGCAYSCCGKGWHRKDGYTQFYRGYVDNLKADEPGTFMLYSLGIGTLSYVVAVRFSEVELIERGPS